VPKPGEVTLAHHGVLFLDELPEFGRHTLDVLREPLETGTIHIARAKAHSTFPAQFQLIAAMNPSPTGDIHDGRCTPDTILRYLNRLSGPLLDRIDLQIDVPRPDPHQYGEYANQDTELSAQQAHEKVCAARKIQIQRQGCLNAHLPITQLQQYSGLSKPDQTFLRDVCHQLSLSLRVYHRCIRVARTLADLDGESHVTRAHLAESLSFRALDTLLREFTNQT
jgi:magnesium chelatase family protein